MLPKALQQPVAQLQEEDAAALYPCQFCLLEFVRLPLGGFDKSPSVFYFCLEDNAITSREASAALVFVYIGGYFPSTLCQHDADAHSLGLFREFRHEQSSVLGILDILQDEAVSLFLFRDSNCCT